MSLFHPTYAFRLSPSGTFPRKEPVSLPLTICRLAVAPTSFASQPDHGRTHDPSKNLPRPSLNFAALLPLRVRAIRNAVRHYRMVEPLGFLPLQGLPALCEAPVLLRRPSRTSRSLLYQVALTVPRREVPKYCSPRWWRRLSRDRLTLLRFVANVFSKFNVTGYWLIVSPWATGCVTAPS